MRVADRSDYEPLLNRELGKLLRDRGLTVEIEKKQRGSTKQIDIQVLADGLILALEGESTEPAALADAKKRLQEAEDGELVAHEAIGVVYPAGLNADNFEMGTEIEWAVLPDTEFVVGTPSLLADVVRRVLTDRGNPDLVARNLGDALTVAVGWLDDPARRRLAKAMNLATTQQVKGKTVDRTEAAAVRALLVIVAAAMFHARRLLFNSGFRCSRSLAGCGIMSVMQGTLSVDRELLDAGAVCGHLLEPGSVHALLAEHRSRLFGDELFEDLFPSGRGRPSVPGEVVAVVMVLQALEGCSDREAVQRLRTDVAWKAAAGLALTDGAFHPTVLVAWRGRLRASGSPDRMFDAVRGLAAETGALAGSERRVLDSTVLDDAVARQGTVQMLRVQIRKLRKLVPQLSQVWVREHNLDPAGPEVDWDDPDDVQRLVSELVDDALELIGACDDIVLDDAQADALGLLALVAGQDTEPGDAPGRWRIARRVASDRVLSVVDPESRHAHKTAHSYRDGYKAHVCAEPGTGLITAVDLTPGNTGDAQAAAGLLAEEPAGTTVIADSAYGAGALRAELQDSGMGAVIKPPPVRTAVEGGYSLDDFDIDAAAGTATCPAGVTVAVTAEGRARFGRHCRGCPVRARCTTAANGRTIRLHPHHDLLAAARAQARTRDFQDAYTTHRPMAERTIAWLVRNNRRCPYIGTAKNRHWLKLRAAAVNLARLTSLGLHHNGTNWAIA